MGYKCQKYTSGPDSILDEHIAKIQINNNMLLLNKMFFVFF